MEFEEKKEFVENYQQLWLTFQDLEIQRNTEALIQFLNHVSGFTLHPRVVFEENGHFKSFSTLVLIGHRMFTDLFRMNDPEQFSCFLLNKTLQQRRPFVASLFSERHGKNIEEHRAYLLKNKVTCQEAFFNEEGYPLTH